MYKAVVIPKAPLCIRDLDPYRHHLKSLDSEVPSTLFPEDPKQSLNISWADRRTNVSVLREAKTRGQHRQKSTQVERPWSTNARSTSSWADLLRNDRRQVFKRGPEEALQRCDESEPHVEECSIEVTLWEETAKDRPLENRHYQLVNCNSRSENVPRVEGKKKA